jgi:AbiV family abortive infection protein
MKLSRSDRFFQSLFGGHSPGKSFELIAMGLSAGYRNADRLLSDVRLLVQAGRLSSAKFLLTTAREELAKSCILIDACRLSPEKHESVLQQLCGAFYDHICKHAYLEVLDSHNIASMRDAQARWEIEVRRWWPAGPEDGEPDMPHDTYFTRELPLYIDYDGFSQTWMMPSDSDQAAYFTNILGATQVSRTENLIETWRKAASEGLCSPEVLSILHEVFKKHYVGDNATHKQLMRLHQRASARVVAQTGVSVDSFMTSPLVKWPLYHLVSKRT